MYSENSLLSQRETLYTLEKEINAKKHNLSFVLYKIIENCENATLILEKCKKSSDNSSFFAIDLKSAKEYTNKLKSFSSSDINDVNRKLSLLKTVTTVENDFLACKKNLALRYFLWN